MPEIYFSNIFRHTPKWCNIKGSFYNVGRLMVWGVGLLILGYLVWKEFTPIVKEYHTNNIGTYVLVQHDQKSIRTKLPAITLCIPRSLAVITNTVHELSELSYNRNPSCKFDDNLDADVLKILMNGTLENVSSKGDELDYYHKLILVPLITNLIHNDSEFEILGLANFPSNQLLIHATWDTFNCIYMYDKQTNMSKYPDMDWCRQNSDLIDQLITNKNKIDKLFYRYADILCDHLHYNDVINDDNLLPKGICLTSLHENHSFFFSKKFCFSVPINGTSTRLTVDTLGTNGYLNVINGSQFSHHYRPFDLYIHTGDIFTYRYMKRYHALYESEDMAESVNVQYTIPFSVLEEREDVPCFQQVSQSECINHCTINKVAKACKCIPFTFRTYVRNVNDSTPYCSTAQYAKCKFDKRTASKVCGSRCKNPCQYVPFQWSISRRSISVKPRRRVFALTIREMGTVHVEFHTTIKTSQEVLISHFAAIVNFYFGFSGLTIITTLVYIFNLCSRYMANRLFRREDKSDQQNQIGKNYPEPRRREQAKPQEEAIANMQCLLQGLRVRLDNMEKKSAVYPFYNPTTRSQDYFR